MFDECASEVYEVQSWAPPCTFACLGLPARVAQPFGESRVWRIGILSPPGGCSLEPLYSEVVSFLRSRRGGSHPKKIVGDSGSLCHHIAQRSFRIRSTIENLGSSIFCLNCTICALRGLIAHKARHTSIFGYIETTYYMGQIFKHTQTIKHSNRQRRYPFASLSSSRPLEARRHRR